MQKVINLSQQLTDGGLLTLPSTCIGQPAGALGPCGWVVLLHVFVVLLLEWVKTQGVFVYRQYLHAS